MINRSDDTGMELRSFIWLQGVLGAGSTKADAVLKHFGSAASVYKADAEKRRSSGIFSQHELARMERAVLSESDRILRRCEEAGIDAIAITDPRYPDCLRNIDDPPFVIYTKGTLPDFDSDPAVCIVGPRKVSEYGAKAAYSLALRLARSGMIVVSGAALGADAFAHRGALKAGGRTVAVLGCGHEASYLPEHRQLRAEIAASGCLISEYPPDTPTTKYSFPVRNRILSALCHATVVIEAGERSGALITARHANEQGREVFAIPGNPTATQYKGSNALLRDGAHLLLDAVDIFNEYIPLYADKIDLERAFQEPEKTKAKRLSKKNLSESLSKAAKIVYNYLDKQKFTADDLLDVGLSAEEILSALTELEIEHFIEALPGGRFTLL